MSSIEYDITSENPLPPGGNPCLHPFKDRHKRMKVLQLLSNSNDASSNSETGEGSFQAHVFKIQIEQTQYALKVFKFQSVTELRGDHFPNRNWRTDDATIQFQSDPFFAECRAYGRIGEYYQNPGRLSFEGEPKRSKRAYKASKKSTPKKTRLRNRSPVANRKKSEIHQEDSSRLIAVPCYGFIDIPANPFEEIVRNKFGISDWNRPEWDKKRPSRSQLPLRGLIKKLVEHEPAIVNPEKMLRDLKTLRKIGVYQGDVAERNYLGGMLVDFGLAWTVPYWAIGALGVHGGDLAERYKHDDLVDFDDMLARSDVEVGWRVRAAKNADLLDRLRPRSDR